MQPKLKFGDKVAVTINGRPTTLVIGREYMFQLKPGTKPLPKHLCLTVPKHLRPTAVS